MGSSKSKLVRTSQPEDPASQVHQAFRRMALIMANLVCGTWLVLFVAPEPGQVPEGEDSRAGREGGYAFGRVRRGPGRNVQAIGDLAVRHRVPETNAQRREDIKCFDVSKLHCRVRAA